MVPLAPQNHLKVRHGIARHFAADTIKSQVRHMVLSATVEAAADFDVQILDGLIQLKVLFGQSLRSSAASPREDEIPSLQVSVPGQAAISTIVPAPGCASPAAFSALYNSGKSLWLTQRRTIFCSTVVRIVSFVNWRAISANDRS